MTWPAYMLDTLRNGGHYIDPRTQPLHAEREVPCWYGSCCQPHLSLDEYAERYGHQSGWEFRSGEALRKPAPTFLHGLLAILLGDLLRLAGYYSAVELDVRITPDWTPRPDACGILQSPVDINYPSNVDVVCEVLSEDENIESKCRDYMATGAVGQVFVLNAERKTIEQWARNKLVSVTDMLLGNGVTIPGQVVWRELDKRRNERPIPPVSMMVNLPECFSIIPTVQSGR